MSIKELSLQSFTIITIVFTIIHFKFYFKLANPLVYLRDNYENLCEQLFLPRGD